MEKATRCMNKTNDKMVLQANTASTGRVFELSIQKNGYQYKPDTRLNICGVSEGT